MHEIALWTMLFAVVVVLVAALCTRWGLPSPLVLTAVGIIGSFLPFIPHEPLEPDLILVVLLPPLLYAAAIQVSLVDLKRDRRGVVLLAVGLVVATAVVVGFVGWWLLPVPLAAALALGSVVAPPDAVAATAIGRRIGLPRRVVTLLEGESLLNDATAIVLLHTTTAAIVGTITVGDLAGGFALSVLGGGAVGVAAAWLLGRLRSHLPDPVSRTAQSLITPWVVYLPAEEIGGSGVLAVVVAGLLLADRSPIQLDATTRISQRINWATIQFLLENAVFLMVGLQLAGILQGVAASELDPWLITGFCAAVFATTVLFRPLWIMASAILPSREGSLTVGELGVLSWAGMRGVVTLAAVFTLPPQTPHREVLVLAAMVVVAGTLLLQGATLPWAARRFGVRGPDPRADLLAAAQVMRTASRAGLAELDRLSADPAVDVDEATVADLRARAQRRADAHWEGLAGSGRAGWSPPGASYRRLRAAMIDAERDAVLEVRARGDVDHEVLAGVMNALDIEESMIADLAERLDRTSSTAGVAVDHVAAPASVAGECEHLRADEGRPDPEPRSQTCPICEAEGLNPVHLRLCLTCGFVGCCDSSQGRHASAHAAETGHPVVRSFEHDEVWRWCYVDEVLG
ncbi:Na+/H+ antiporter [Agilicoccus flavus]|uniref:Na+/H+ antiporter n=1 Tax=Agilicoccus flavus TaxID=2775968 RepID=UPI001CF6F419|nr:Na+/H+ antiporter [Agilicoccus flavus]